MAQGYVSVLSVIWQECVDREICINLPIIGQKRVSFRACLRAVQEDGTIYVELEASGRRWRYELANGCDTPLDWGIGRLTLCMKTTDGRVQVVLDGSVAVHNVTKSLPLIAKDLRFVPMSSLPEGELMMLGFGDPGFGGFTMDPRMETGTLVSDLTSAEQQEVLSQKGDT